MPVLSRTDLFFSPRLFCSKAFCFMLVPACPLLFIA